MMKVLFLAVIMEALLVVLNPSWITVTCLIMVSGFTALQVRIRPRRGSPARLIAEALKEKH